MQGRQDGHGGGEDADSDDSVWQSIIDNYGDPVLDAGDIEDVASAAASTQQVEPIAFVQLPDEDQDEERFVPPPPPPVPVPRPDRMLAWIGLLGSPIVVLVSVIFHIGMPSLLGMGLIAAFLGGFGYLILTMDNEPPDPWDDGAQV